MSKNIKRTSDNMASLAAETLSNPNSSAIAKSLAASALAQSGNDKQTSAEMEEKAGKALQSDNTATLQNPLLPRFSPKPIKNGETELHAPQLPEKAP